MARKGGFNVGVWIGSTHEAKLSCGRIVTKLTHEQYFGAA